MRVKLKIDFNDLIDDFETNNEKIAFLIMNTRQNDVGRTQLNSP